MLPRKNRLHLQRDIERVKRHGRPVFGDLFTLRFVARPAGQHSRFAISVSKRVSKKATDRNLVTRRTRAIVAELLPSFPSPYDVILSARKQIKDYDFDRCRRDLTLLFERSGILTA